MRWIDILLLIGFCAVPIGLAVFSDRAPSELCRRVTSWPFRTMPTTNGAIFGLLFIGGMAVVFYWIIAKVGALG